MSVEAAVLHTAKTKPVGWVKEEMEMSLFCNSLKEQLLDLTVLHRQIWNYFSGAESAEWHLTEILCFYSSLWATLSVCVLRLRRPSHSMLILGPWGGGCTGRTRQGARGWCRVHMVLSDIHRDIKNFWGRRTLQSDGVFCKYPCKSFSYVEVSCVFI